MRIDGTQALATTPSVVVRNTMFNFVGQGIVAATAILVLPLIVRGLGTSAYGLLSLAIITFSSFSLLEFGLGRTTTKFVAEFLGKGELERLGQIIWTSILIQLAIGILFGCAIALAAPLLAQQILKLPEDLLGEAQTIMLILAVAVPVTSVSSSLRGALEGAQRFDLVNYVKVALNLSTYLIPLLGAFIGLRVSVIVLMMLGSRMAADLAYLFGCFYTLPVLKHHWPRPDAAMIRMLLTFSGWLAVSGLAVLFLVQINQYLIGALVSVEAITFYSVPYLMLSGLSLLPAAMVAALFPAYSGLQAKGQGVLEDLYVRPISYIMVGFGPFILVVFVFARDLLLVWQGPELAAKSAVVLQLLIAGALINAIVWVPVNLLTGLGYPKLVAKSHLIQLSIYPFIAYFLIAQWSVVGAAAAFLLRVIFEAALIFGAVGKAIPEARGVLLSKRVIRSTALLGLFMLPLWGIHTLQMSLLVLAIQVLFLLSAFSVLVWVYIFDERDRKLIYSAQMEVRQIFLWIKRHLQPFQEHVE